MGKLSSIWGKRNHATSSDAPEKIASRSVKSFCESGAQSNSEDEVLHLPAIVDAAEASPNAAGAAAAQIQSYLTLDFDRRASCQYNAIMLMRILADNPGPSFTKHVDKKFTSLVRDMLKRHRDPSIQQILRESLDSWEIEKVNDPNLRMILDMWKSEKQIASRYQVPDNAVLAVEQYQAQNNQLPDPQELAGRVEEAKNSAKLLVQLSQSTSPWDFADNDLLKEFSKRCQNAQRSVQGFMNCIPPPDEYTFQTLIETSEQLSVAMNKYQRASLAAQRTTSTGNVPPAQPTTYSNPTATNFTPTYDAQENSFQQRQEAMLPAAIPTQPQPQPVNPFDDSNKVPVVSRNPYQTSPRDAPSHSSRTLQPVTGAVELPLARTPSPTLQSIPLSPPSPPTTTSPARKPISGPYSHQDEEDLYSTPPRLPNTNAYQHQRQMQPAFNPHSKPHAPPPQLAPPRHELQGTPSYYARQELASTEVVMSGAASPPPPSSSSRPAPAPASPPAAHPSVFAPQEYTTDMPTPLGERNTVGGRLRNDDPVSPVAEGSGWRTWGQR